MLFRKHLHSVDKTRHDSDLALILIKSDSIHHVKPSHKHEIPVNKSSTAFPPAFPPLDICHMYLGKPPNPEA